MIYSCVSVSRPCLHSQKVDVMFHPVRFRRSGLLTRLLLLTFAVAIVAGISTTSAAETGRQVSKRQQLLNSMQVLGSVYERIYYSYVDDVEAQELLESGIQGMLEHLDAHSQYLTPKSYEDLMMSTEGEFGGLGITINVRDHYPTVVSPIEGTPAFFMGVQGGDQIVEIEGESTYDFTSDDAVKLLRGDPGTKVTISIAREGFPEPFPLTITRDVIKVESVPYAFMIDGIGYVRIQNFSRTTRDELVAKIKDLDRQGMKGLVLDLRWNPGGLLDAAYEVSELFLEQGQLIVYTKGRLQSQNRSYHAENGGRLVTGVPIVVMVNGSSASASEILAAALQDHDHALVVGKTSFGKGSVQTVYRLTEDSALKLTTAKYYTPSGRSIHKDRHRDDSDIDLTMAEADSATAAAEVPREEKARFLTDNGRVVYGGGGVTPDIEIEQPYLSDFEVALERDGALFSFASWYAARNAVDEAFRADDAVVASFHEFLRGRENIEEYLGFYELSLSDSLLTANDDYIRWGVRREIMRREFGPQAAYEVAIEKDEQLEHTLDLFDQAPTLDRLLALAQEWNAEQLTKAEDSVAETEKLH